MEISKHDTSKKVRNMKRNAPSEFSRLANLMAAADPITFRALDINSRAQGFLQSSAFDLERAHDVLAKANMNIMDATTIGEARTHLKQLKRFANDVRRVLTSQVTAAKAIMVARFPVEMEDE